MLQKFDGENREPVQMITEFFIYEAISNVEEGARLIGSAGRIGAEERNTSLCGDEMKDNPISNDVWSAQQCRNSEQCWFKFSNR